MVATEVLDRDAFVRWLGEQGQRKFAGYDPCHNPLAVYYREREGGSVRILDGKVLGASIKDVRAELPEWAREFRFDCHRRTHTIDGKRVNYGERGLTAAEALALLDANPSEREA